MVPGLYSIFSAIFRMLVWSYPFSKNCVDSFQEILKRVEDDGRGFSHAEFNSASPGDGPDSFQEILKRVQDDVYGCRYALFISASPGDGPDGFRGS